MYNPQIKPDLQERITKEIFEWVDAIAVSIIVVVLIFTFGFKVVGVVGQSMKNTLFEDDKVILTHLGYTPKVGDIVVISRNYENDFSNEDDDNSPIIKRVIATEFQKVDIRDGKVYVDEDILDEPYLNGVTTEGREQEYPYIIPEGHIFVLGDNRPVSLDSRRISIGSVDTRYVLGKAVFRIFPASRFGGLYNYDTEK